MGSIVLGARLILAAVFATAGVAKAVDRAGTRRSLGEFGVPANLLPVVAVLLPLVELTTAILLVPAPLARAGAIAALVLLLAFVAGIAHALSDGRAPDCHCFGQVHSAPAGRTTIARNGALAVLAGIVVIGGPGPAVDSWFAARTAAELVAIAATVIAIGFTLLALRLRNQNIELRSELDDAQRELAMLPAGLPVKASAPHFLVPDLSGTQRSLESLLARGRPLLLLFVSPDCTSCGRLLPEVGRWQTMLADRLSIAVITHGSVADNLALRVEHGIDDVLVQPDTEVMKDFRIRLTPTALIVTPEGRIGSTLAEGVLAIEPLIRVTLRRLPTQSATGAALRQPA
jgi:uncharacterized membrane protein YphA (DoxX/SURF4 family)